MASEPARPADLRLVEIEWVDSVAHWRWEHPDDLRRWAVEETMIQRSVGWILSESESYVQLVSSVGEDGESASGSLQIPRVAILRVRDLARSDT